MAAPADLMMWREASIISGPMPSPCATVTGLLVDMIANPTGYQVRLDWIERATREGGVMQFLRFGIFLVIGACLPAVFLKAADEPATANGTAAWSSKAAAGYLDARMDWWAGWKSSARDHATFSVSCHT